MCTFIGILRLHFSGMWRGLLHDLCSKIRMCLLVSPVRVETPKKTNMNPLSLSSYN